MKPVPSSDHPPPGLPTASRAGARPAVPLLKWPGGKAGELRQITAAMPAAFDRYAEPFVGGGAVFFSLPVTPGAVLNDVSGELMALYRRVQQEDAVLLDHLWAIDRWWQDCGEWVTARATPLVDAWRHRHRDERFSRHVADEVERSVDATVALVPAEFASLSTDVARRIRDTVPRKLLRMRAVEVDRGVELPQHDVWRNLEGAYKAVIYTALRAEYNRGRSLGRQDGRQTALFFFLREYAYASMFRFNARGGFNVPYGGISYNRKDFAGKIKHLQSHDVLTRLQSARVTCLDFEECLEAFAPTKDDFVFLDPPYDSDFSDYDLNPFSPSDHRRLGDLLRAMDAPFLLVIKATPFIERLYPADEFRVTAFDKTYMWTIKERNDRQATHLMITNYDPPVAGA